MGQDAITLPMPPPTRPPPYATSEDALAAETRVEFFVAGGPGGQHRNKTATGVRLHHAPSGLLVTATERRSQHENLAVAWARLRGRLTGLNRVKKPRKQTRPTRGSQERRLAGKAQRGERKRARRPPREDA